MSRHFILFHFRIQRLLDLNVNNDDYREIGTGRVVVSQNSGSNSDQHFLLDVPTGESIEDYCNRFVNLHVHDKECLQDMKTVLTKGEYIHTMHFLAVV
jgi:hypothetical protein